MALNSESLKSFINELKDSFPEAYASIAYAKAAYIVVPKEDRQKVISEVLELFSHLIPVAFELLIPIIKDVASSPKLSEFLTGIEKEVEKTNTTLFEDPTFKENYDKHSEYFELYGITRPKTEKECKKAKKEEKKEEKKEKGLFDNLDPLVAMALFHNQAKSDKYSMFPNKDPVLDNPYASLSELLFTGKGEYSTKLFELLKTPSSGKQIKNFVYNATKEYIEKCILNGYTSELHFFTEKHIEEWKKLGFTDEEIESLREHHREFIAKHSESLEIPAKETKEAVETDNEEVLKA
jgi:hypothetical protein